MNNLTLFMYMAFRTELFAIRYALTVVVHVEFFAVPLLRIPLFIKFRNGSLVYILGEVN
jgi:hypothetical protein